MGPVMVHSRGLACALVALLPLCAKNATAQDVADAGLAAHRTVSIQPRISVKETFTDNVRLASTGAQSDAITEIAPGISASVQTSNLKAFLDYTASEVLYANSAASQRVLNTLNTFGTLEAVQNWAYLDFSGSIGQQAVSAFGTQSSANTSINANQTEVSTYRVSPRVQGHIGEAVNYVSHYSQTATYSSASAAGSQVSTSDAELKFSSAHDHVGLGWWVGANGEVANYATTRSTRSTRVSVGLPYTFSPQFAAALIAGSEVNNFRNDEDERFTSSGYSFDWLPSELSKLSVRQERHSFGDTHSVTFDSRSALTAWKFSDVKEVGTATGRTVVAGSGNVYDLLYSQFAGIQPDPLARAQLVSSYLQANGISPSTNVTNGYLSFTQALQRRQELSFALLGKRDTITVVAMQSESTNLEASAQGGDLANGVLLKQHGINVSYAHRLTPDMSMGLAVSQSVSGSSAGQDSTMDAYKAYLTRRLSGNSIFTLEARRVISVGLTPYTETALTCSVNIPI